MVEKDFFFFHFSYRITIRSNLMNVKNALWIKLSLLVLSVMLGLCLVMGLNFTTAKADQPTNQVTMVKQWDVSKNQDGSLTATLFTNATQIGLYDLVIQGSGEMYNWNQTSDKAFWYTEGYDLASVTLNEGLTSIGTNAFWNCRDLTSIDIPSTVKNIYSCAFWGATSLTTVTGGENVEHVKLGAFHLSPITSYPFETSTKLKTIEYQAFEYTNLSRVVLPQSLKQVWYNAFRGCENLTEVIVKGAKTTFLADGNGVYNAFIGCKNLTTPTLEEGSARYSLNGPYLMDGTVLVRAFGNGTIDASVTEIAPNAFNGCGALTEITVPATVATIGHSAFADCPKLVSAVIETPITATVSRMFDGCRSLIEVTLPDTVTEYAHATFRSTGFVTFTVPANVQVIGTYAFAETERLTNVYFNEGLKVVGGYAFANATALTELMLPNGTEKIGGTACTGCTSLARVRIAPTVTYIGDGAFYGCFFLKSLYIPKSVTYLGGLILYGVEKSTVISIESTFAGA